MGQMTQQQQRVAEAMRKEGYRAVERNGGWVVVDADGAVWSRTKGMHSPMTLQSTRLAACLVAIGDVIDRTAARREMAYHGGSR